MLRQESAGVPWSEENPRSPKVVQWENVKISSPTVGPDQGDVSRHIV